MKSLLVAALLAATAIARPAVAATDPIQPGDYMQVGWSACTMNFVYDGTGSNAGKTYVGTAAHCVSAIGEDVYTINGELFGDVAFIGDANFTGTDFAFVQVRTAYLPRISAAVKGHPSYPTGYTTFGATNPGDPIQLSGYGTGFSVTNVTQERRVGVLGLDNQSVYDAFAPVVWGDSGGPLVHVLSGKALGINSRICVADTCTATGPTVEGIIATAAILNFPVTLRTVP